MDTETAKKVRQTLLSAAFFVLMAAIALLIWQQCIASGASGAVCRELIR